ncbi:(2Fe-2S)-binding protein [filamentous cyanobacterium LEGE 11480]|uniref:(2Fe-2S)-binding protein n=1 Tax=Romeriopsis navalis LEGE 11480 TaxID=2777977 RepID=A0A928Z624_9CYAN|nr:(2Fe-2S)-binding protein [Romeriopsis navalis]MBE9032597.1 (2Fe-2S)-binding protein [Romeriopsis navalis LEGE 11480]
MPTITAQGQTFTCELGANLRRVLLQQGVALYNGGAAVINCRSLGTCGTCAVQIDGSVSPLTWKERTRLALPPHQGTGDRRLACQVKVLGDIQVRKLDGFWGQGETVVWCADKPAE